MTSSGSDVIIGAALGNRSGLFATTPDADRSQRRNWKEKRWAELAALVRFARRDVPVELAQTDPALYRRLREQITRFFLLGGDLFSLEALEAKARG